MRHKTLWQFVVLSGVILGLGTQTQAQTTRGDRLVYPAKFVCGFATGNVPLMREEDPFPAPYEDLKPGNYATVVNILNLAIVSPQINVLASVEGIAGTPRVDTLRLSQLQTRRIGCVDIIPALAGSIPGGLNGAVIEGYLLVSVPASAQDILEVQAVYTYATKDEFDTREFQGVDIVDNLRPVFPQGNSPRLRIMAGAGAGGLGLGGSIHVQKIEPRQVPGLVFNPIPLPAPSP